MSNTLSIIPSEDVEVLAIIQRLPEHEDKIPIRNLMKALWMHGPTKGKANLRRDIVANQDPLEDLLKAALRWAGVIRARTSNPATPRACPQSSVLQSALRAVLHLHCLRTRPHRLWVIERT